MREMPNICVVEVWVSYEAWQGAAAVVHMAICEDYPRLGIRTLCWLARLKACHFTRSTGCLLGITPVLWWTQAVDFPAVRGHDGASTESHSRPCLGCKTWGTSAFQLHQCEDPGRRKSTWCFTRGRGCWNLQRPRLTFSSTNTSWQVTGRCQQLRSASGACSTCTMSWGTFTPMVSLEINRCFASRLLFLYDSGAMSFIVQWE